VIAAFRKYLGSLTAVLGVTLGGAALVLLLTQDVLIEFTPLKRAELSLIDLRFQKRAEQAPKDPPLNVVIVEISHEAQKSLPERYPWPRTYYARLIKNLQRAGAKAVGIDILFDSPDARSPEGDAAFSKALRESGIAVLAGYLQTETQWVQVMSGSRNYANLFIDSTTPFGLVNIPSDVDGIRRRYMPFLYEEGADLLIPTFSMAVLSKTWNLPPLTAAAITDSGLLVLQRPVPMFDGNSFLINYIGPTRTFPRISVADVLDDSTFETAEELEYGTPINTFDDPGTGLLAQGVFTGKIVLIGSTMPEDKDLFNIPLMTDDRQNQMYGVELHANVIQNVMDNNFITRQPLWSIIVVVVVLSLFTLALIASLKAIRSRFSALIEVFGILITISELVLIYWLSIKLFTERSYLVDMMSPFLAVVVSYIGSTVYNYVTERKQKMMIKTMFGHYVNRDVVNELVEHPEKLQLSGERRELTVMFSDIEKFTTIAEKMNAEELVAMLNEYLNDMTAIIFGKQGTVDKYEGDAIMAFWGAPVAQSRHALLACTAALEMQHAVGELQTKWRTLRRPTLRIRIGISTGEMIVGNIGGSGKYEYTVIGDSVNLGSRLESANKQYGTGILLSENTYTHVANDVVARELDLLLVAGKTRPITVYELIALKGGKSDPRQDNFLKAYREGFALYRERKWDKALAAFNRALAESPDDGPCKLYIERSEVYRATPPPEDWDGVFIMKSK
jgi:adenylate cyclase